MTWTGDPENDVILSLMDNAGESILGQVSRDGQSKDWHGYYYTPIRGRKHVGAFESLRAAQLAVESATRSPARRA
jgi:hypothetical protein